MTTHGDLNASNLIGPVPMLVDCKRDCYPTFRRGSGGGVMRPDERSF
jgi:hypothetical protein